VIVAKGVSVRSLALAGGLLSFTLIIAILYTAKVVLLPLALAIMLAFVLNPAVVLLQRWGFSRVPAVLSTVALTALLVGGLIWIVSLQFNNLVNDLPRYQGNIRSKIIFLREASKGSALNRIRTKIQDLVQKQGGEGSKDGSEQGAAGEPIPTRIVSDDGLFAKVLGPLRALSPALEWLARFVLALMLAIFMLIRREDVRNRIVSFAAKGSLTTTTKALNDAGQRISRYMVMQLIINGGFGVVIGLGLFLIGVPYALVWGLCAAVLRYIPYVGAWIAAIPPLAINFVSSSRWTDMLLVFGLFLVLELILGNVIEPLLYGQGTGVSEVALLVCAAFWAWLWGPVGLMLATPLTVCVVVAGKYVPSLAFFDKLLGDRPTLKPHTVYLQRLLAKDLLEAAAVVRDYRKQNSAESVYDALFVPALILARQDRASGAMLAEDEEYVVRQTMAIVNDIRVSETKSPLHRDSSGAQAAAGGRDPMGVQVVGFPAHHEVEELTLNMLGQLVAPSGFHVEVCSTRTLPSEMISKVKQEMPALVFVAALPPGGLPQASYLCERLRESLPQLGIIVGYWGCETNLDEIIVSLRSAGANYVTTTLLGGRSHILSMLASRSPELPAVESDAFEKPVSSSA
jgi:predicted PurR-regulated permease PerM